MFGTWFLFVMMFVFAIAGLASLAKASDDDNPVLGILGGILLLASVGCLVGWLLLWGPWFQPLWFHVFFNNLGFWLVLVLIIGTVAALVATVVGLATGEWATGAGTFMLVFVVGFVVWMSVYWVLGGKWTLSKVYQQETYNEIRALPDTSAVRFLPLEVARIYGRAKLQEPRIHLGDAEPIVRGNEVLWIMPRTPKGFWNETLRRADGFAIVDNEGNVEMFRQEMSVGEGMDGRDAISWKLRQTRYWSTVNEVYYVQDTDGTVVAVAPFMDYSFSWPVMVPKWGGVFLVHSDGRIETLTPAKAMEHSLLKDVRIVPEKWARLKVEAYALKNGIRNSITTHEDQVQIPSVSTIAGGNEMPFLLPTTNGQKWFVATVPWGAEGIFRVFLVDAITGFVELFPMPKDSSVIGPLRARPLIVDAYPQYKWDQLDILEPRPIIRFGEFFWMFTVTTSSHTGVTDTILVNARTHEVLSLGTKKDTILRFLRGEDVGRLVSTGIQEREGEGTQNLPVGPVDAAEVDEAIRQLEEALQVLKRYRESLLR